ncbi:MAG: ATP-binding protein [Nitrospirota bacterium]|nr:ATP-binding protein [Nitrospirota bacterium]
MTGLFFSIKARLFLWLTALGLTLLTGLGFFLYFEVSSIIFGSVDHLLHSKIQIIKGLIHEEHGEIELELSEVIAGDYSVPLYGHYYKVLMDGKIIAYSPSLVRHDFDLDAKKDTEVPAGNTEMIYLSQGPDQEPLRIAKNSFILLDRHFTVFAAESIAECLSMLGLFRRFLFLTLSASVIILSVGGLLIIRDSLKPLSAFSSKISRITHKTMKERIDTATEALELRGIADSFNKMLARLQKAFDAEQRLIADASHELKTPVAVIRSQCDVTLQRDRGPEEYKEALQSIRSTSKGMMHIINNMISLARLDSGLLEPPDISQISVKACLDTVLQLVASMATEREVGIGISCEEGLTVQGDESRLTEAFLAVIENAVKYSKRGGDVSITVREGAGRVIIAVQDFGIGISRENMDRIFDRFYRGEAVKEIEGTGLGLSIAKTIIEAHGGQITAESRLGKGTSVSIIL